MALISVSEAKRWLRGSGTAEDATISDLIASVAAHLENEYGLIIDQAERTWSFDRFPQLMILTGVPVDPDSVAVTYLDGAGEEQTVDDVRTVMVGRHVRVLPPLGTCWPAPACGAGVVTVTADAGWDDETLPADIKTAARLALARWYDNRDAEFPKGACDLLEPYRLRRV